MGCEKSVEVSTGMLLKYKFAAQLFVDTPSNPQNQTNKHQKKGQYQNIIESSISHYQEFIEANPRFDHPFDGLGCVQDQIGYYEGEVSEWYKKKRQMGCIQGNPYDALSICLSLRQKTGDAEEWYLRMIKQNPDLYQLYFGLANVYYKLQLFQKAEQFYRKSLELNPRLDKAYQNIASIYCYHLYDNGRAGEWARFSLKINSLNQYSGLIRELVKTNLENRIASLLTLASRNPEYARICNALGTTYLELDQVQKAIDWFQHGIEINPNYYALYCGLAIGYNSRGDTDSAIRMSQQSIRMNPNHHEPYLNLGDAYKRKTNILEAEKWYKKCLEVNESIEIAYFQLAKIYVLNGKEIEGELFLERVIKINPDYVPAMLELGKIKLNRGENKQALEFFRRVLEVDENQVECLSILSAFFNEKQKKGEDKDICVKRILNKLDSVIYRIDNEGTLTHSTPELQKFDLSTNF